MAIYFDLPKEGRVTLTNDIDLSTDAQAVMDSVVNIITTEKKSKVFTKRDFGTSLEQYLFDPCDIYTAISIYQEIERGINKYEPRALNVKVEVTPLPNDNNFTIDIFFEIEESENPIELNTSLKKIR